MHQQLLIRRIILGFIFIHSFYLVSSTEKAIYDKAVTDLSIILREEPRVGAKAINRLNKEIVPELQKHDLFSVAVVGSVFKFAFIQHLAEHQIKLTPGLSEQNISSVCFYINSVFPSNVQLWSGFIENIGLFSGEELDDRVVQEAFEEVRQKTVGPYLKYADYLRSQFDAIAAFNTIPALKYSE